MIKLGHPPHVFLQPTPIGIHAEDNMLDLLSDLYLLAVLRILEYSNGFQFRREPVGVDTLIRHVFVRGDQHMVGEWLPDIDSGFAWCETIEGARFWSKVSDTPHGNKLPEIPTDSVDNLEEFKKLLAEQGLIP